MNIKQKLKNLRFKIKHKLFVLKRKWLCHPFLHHFYPKKTIYRRLLAFFLVFLLILPVFSFFLHTPKASAAWFDNSYAYRQKFTFTHNAAINSQRSITLTLDTASLISAGVMQSDCDDTRFTDNNGKVLTYQLTEACNETWTTYEVLFPSIASGSNVGYVYYGNPRAVSASVDNLAWDTSKAVYESISYDPSGVADNPTDLFFNHDGTKMYVLGWTNDRVYQFTLSTPWNISTAVSANKNMSTGIVEDTDYAMYNKPDGTKLYITSGDDHNIRQYTLSTPWDVSTGSYDSVSFNISAQDGDPYDIGFSTDGKKMFVLGYNNDTIYSYTLGTAWNVSTAVYDSVSYDVYPVDHSPQSFTFSSDGKKLYIEGTEHDEIYYYTLASAWDLSTISNNSKTFDSSGQDNIPLGPRFKSGGTKMYMLGYDNERIYQYSLSTLALQPSGGDPAITTRTSEEKGSGPALYYNFDQVNSSSTIVPDLSSNKNDGTISGGASGNSQKSCLVENCLYFDGVDGEVTTPLTNSTDLDTGLASGFTFQTWIKPTSDGENHVGQIFNKRALTYARITNAGTDGLADLEVSIDLTGTDESMTFVNAINLNKWQLISIGYTDDSEDEASVYIDGKAVTPTTDSNASGAPASDFNNLRIGGTNSAHFKGYMDEFKVYPYERTSDQIKTDFGKVPSLHGKSAAIGDDKSFINNGLIGYWKLDEGVDIDAIDSSGNNLTLTNIGMQSEAGKFDYSANCDLGADDYMYTNTAINNIKSASFWIYPDALTNNYLLNFTNSSSYITVNSSGVVSATGFTNPSIYVNGVLNGTVTASTWSLVTISSDTFINASAFTIGRTNNGSDHYCVNINIDDVRLYSRILTQSDVTSLYDWAPGPVGWWKLDEGSGASAYDSSGNGNTAALEGNPVWTTGKIGKAIKFINPDNDNMAVANSDSINPDNALTIEFWIKKNKPTAGFAFFIGKTDFATGWSIGNDDGANTDMLYLRMDTSGGTNQVPCENDNVLDGQWHHVVFTLDSGTNPTCKAFKDGVLVYSDDYIPGTGFANASEGLGIEGGDDGTATYDDIRLYNYARTAKQIVQDMNAGHPAVGSGEPVAYYKFDEGYGLTAHNSGSAGSIIDLLLDPSDTPTWTNDSKFGKALMFDGANDNTYTADTSYTGSPNLTASLWVKFNALNNGEQDIIDTWYSGDHNWGFNEDENNGKLTWWVYVGSTWYPVDVDSSSLSLNRWYHIVGTYDGENSIVYIDGIERGRNTTPSGDIVTASDYIENWTFSGKLDEVKIYNYALNPDEVKTEYNRGSSVVMGALSTEGTIIASGSGANVAGAGANDASYGTIAWNGGTPANITLTDNSYATVRLNGTNNTNYLKADNFGYAIPANAIIKGITMQIEHRRTGGGGSGNARDNVVKLVKGGSVVGNNYAKTGVNWAGTDEWIYYGSTTDNWGTTWTPSDINSSNFGAVIAATGDAGSNRDANVDTIWIIVAYSYPGTAGINSQSRAYCVPGDTSTCESPIAEWKLDERQGTTANDTSGNNNTGTLTSGPLWTNGEIGSGIKFDGVNDLINAGSNTSIDNVFANGGTITAWIKPKGWGGRNSGLNYGRIIDKSSNAHAANGFGFELNQETLYPATIVFQHGCSSSGDYFWQAPNNSITLNQWQHVAVTFNKSSVSNNPIIYINGVAQTLMKSSESTCTGGSFASDAAQDMLIGNNLFDLEEGFDGTIDDVHVYNYTRTPAQVAWDYNRGAPVAHYKFDECQGTIAHDSSDNHLDGTIIPGNATGNNDSVGSCSSTAANPANEMWNDGTTGKFNSALGFDGTNDYVDTGDIKAFNSASALTISAWFKRRAPNSFIYLAKTNSLDEVEISTRDNGDVVVQLQTGGTQIGNFYPSNDTNWHHIVIVFDGSQPDNATRLKAYFDGSQQTLNFSGTIRSTTPDLSGYNFEIGRKASTNAYSDGLIDDVRIYNYALTAPQIKTLYNENSALRFGPLTGSP